MMLQLLLSAASRYEKSERPDRECNYLQLPVSRRLGCGARVRDRQLPAAAFCDAGNTPVATTQHAKRITACVAHMCKRAFERSAECASGFSELRL